MAEFDDSRVRVAMRSYLDACDALDDAATIGAGALGWALVRHFDHRGGRIAVWALVVLYAGTVGWTRIWLGVHWPLDVVGGWLFASVSWGYIFIINLPLVGLWVRLLKVPSVPTAKDTPMNSAHLAFEECQRRI